MKMSRKWYIADLSADMAYRGDSVQPNILRPNTVKFNYV